MAHLQTDVLGFQLILTAEEAEGVRTGALSLDALVHDEQVLASLARTNPVDIGEANEGHGVVVRHDWSESPVSIVGLPPPSVPKVKKQPK